MMVYEAFKKLPDDYIVFYSVKWGEEGFDRKYRKGEADFLVFDPSRGFLVIEVKTGGIKRAGDGRWFIIDRNGKEHQLAYSPLDQAWRNVTRFQDMLASSPNDMNCQTLCRRNTNWLILFLKRISIWLKRQ